MPAATALALGVWRWLKGRWDWSAKNKEQLTILFTIIAAFYVWFEYTGNQIDAKIKRTMDFQARYSEKELLSARTALDNLLFDPNLNKILAGTGLKGNDAISAVVIDRKLDPHVRLLADFYGQVATCMKHSLCDADTACATFRLGAKELRDNYYGLFERWQKDWNTNLMEPTYLYFEAECGKQSGGLFTRISRWF